MDKLDPLKKSHYHSAAFDTTLLTNFITETRKPQLKTNKSRITQELKKKTILKHFPSSKKDTGEQPKFTQEEKALMRISITKVLTTLFFKCGLEKIKKSWSSDVFSSSLLLYQRY